MYNTDDMDTSYSHSMDTSFDAFLAALSEEEMEEMSKGNEAIKTDNLDTATDGWEFDEEKQELFEELFEEEVEGVEDEEFSDEEEAEEAEEAEFDYKMEDWNSAIILPDGVAITADKLKEFSEFEHKVSEFNSKATEVSKKERMLADNTNMTMNAFNNIRQQLEHASTMRPLTVLEQAQLQTLTQTQQYVNNTVNKFNEFHAHNIANAENIANQQLSDNMDVCFELYPNLIEDIQDIKNYLTEKKVPDASKFLNDIKMDPAIISILQDAVATNKVKKKVFTPARKVSRSVQGQANVAQRGNPNTMDILQNAGVSSHDIDNFKSFLDVYDF